jgi:hypothetical protein
MCIGKMHRLPTAQGPMYSTGLAKSKGKCRETVGFRIRTESVFDFDLLYPDPSVKIVL